MALTRNLVTYLLTYLLTTGPFHNLLGCQCGLFVQCSGSSSPRQRLALMYAPPPASWPPPPTLASTTETTKYDATVWNYNKLARLNCLTYYTHSKQHRSILWYLIGIIRTNCTVFNGKPSIDMPPPKKWSCCDVNHCHFDLEI